MGNAMHKHECLFRDHHRQRSAVDSRASRALANQSGDNTQVQTLSFGARTCLRLLTNGSLHDSLFLFRGGFLDRREEPSALDGDYC